MEATELNDAGVERAAVLLVLLGEEVAGTVLRHCSEEEIRSVGEAIARLGPVNDALGAEVLSEYNERVLRGSPEVGGPERAERILRRVLPAAVVGKIVKRPESLSSASTEAPEETLGGPIAALSPEALGGLLEDESPQAAALLLAHLGPEQAAATLSLLPEERMADIAARIGRLRSVDPEVVEQVALVLGERIEDNALPDETAEDSGIERLGSILNLVDRASARGLIAGLQKTDPELAEQVRQKLFTFELLLQIDLRGLQEILKQVEQKQLAVSLKGADEEIAEHVFTAMSERAQQMMREEMEYMGSVRVKEIDEAQREIMQVVARLEEEGTLEVQVGPGEE